MTEKSHRINESADKITLKAKLVRGTATRDQDKIDVKVKGDDPEATVDRLDAVLANLAESAESVRAIQPEVADDE